MYNLQLIADNASFSGEGFGSSCSRQGVPIGSARCAVSSSPGAVQRATCLLPLGEIDPFQSLRLLSAQRIARQARQRQTAAMQVQAATKSDIPAIMRVERTEGYAHLIGRWEAEQHSTEIEKPSCRYLVARDGTGIAGFAILQNIGSTNQSVRLRRIAVENIGRGVGSLLLRSVLQTCFEDLAANRLELFVFVDNQRAHRTYRCPCHLTFKSIGQKLNRR